MEQTKNFVKIIKNQVQHYDWGSKDPNCLVSKISKSQKQPWAQLWMGTHPKGQSYISKNQTLRQYLQRNNHKNMKFLFKVLSIQKCLSIQVHPNKQQAIKLHHQKPSIYIDSNQKPQIFFSLSQFSCYLGFISQEQFNRILMFEPFKTINQYKKVQKQQKFNKITQFLGKILSFSSQQTQLFIQQLLANYESIYSKPQDIKRKQSLIQLSKQFPKDIGIIVSCLLNFLVLPPGQCFFIDAGVPHAYFHGQCLELMNSSDNVVRLGLTPKLKDSETLMQIISEFDEKHLSQTVKLLAKSEGKYQFKYEHNNLFLTKITGKSSCYLNGSSLCLSLEGNFFINKIKLQKYQIAFLPSGEYNIQGEGELFIVGSSTS